MRIFVFSILLLLNSSEFAFAKESELAYANSITKKLTSVNHDTARIVAYNEFGDFFGTSLPDSAIVYYRKAKKLAEQLLETSDSDININNLKSDLAQSLINIGVIHRHKGETSLALEFYSKSLSIYEEINNKTGMAQALNNIGVIYRLQNDITRALESYQQSLKIREEVADSIGMAHSYNNIGVIYRMQSEIPNALKYYKKSIALKERSGDSSGKALTLRNVGLIYQEQGEFEKALNYFTRSLNTRLEIGDKRGMASTMISIGETCLLMNRIDEALSFGSRSYNISKDLGFPSLIERSARLLKQVYEKQGDFRKAYHYFYEEVLMRDTIAREENFRETMRLQARYEFEKKIVADSLKHLQQISLKDLELRRQKFAIYFLGLFFLFVIILGFFVYRNYLIKRKTNLAITQKNIQLEQAFEEIKTVSETLSKQNTKLKVQNDQMAKQRDEIEEQRNALANIAWELQDKGEEVEKQRNILALKNKDITDSIVYAQRIQEAVLPTQCSLDGLFEEHFVLFKPKSIVSGDFYWTTQIQDLVVFCVTDCTGHGVPGAFMSIMGTSFLNEIVRKEEVTNAAEVLNVLRNFVVSSLGAREQQEELFDGMDVGICILNTKTYLMQFAGANIPCWINSQEAKNFVDNNRIIESNGLIEIKPDRMPIGRFERMEPFTFAEVQLKKGTVIYIATDGYADQFGGPNMKKFQKQRLMKLLSKNSHKSLGEQKNLLEEGLDAWRGSSIQIDDITVLGVKL